MPLNPSSLNSTESLPTDLSHSTTSSVPTPAPTNPDPGKPSPSGIIYSQADLDTIEDLAAIFMKISEIAVILDVPPEALRDDIASRYSPASRAYLRGKITAKIKIRRSEMDLAGIGSPIAVENILQAHSEMLDDEL